MIQRIRPSLSSAVYLSLACSIILNGVNGFHAREATLFALPSAALLLCAVSLTKIYFPYSYGKCALVLIVALLTFAAAYEVHALWRLYLVGYNGEVPLGFVAAAVFIPTIYLRRKSPLAQSSNFLLALVGITLLLMIVSVAPQLRVTNLLTSTRDATTLGKACGYEVSTVPELLIVALLSLEGISKKQDRYLPAKSIILLCLGRATIYVILELFYGNAVMWRSDAFHTATASGTISMFKRMEWLQLLLWTLVVSVKVALFFYATWMILQKHGLQSGYSEKGTTIPITRWIIMTFYVSVLIRLMKGVDFEILQFYLIAATWIVWLLITMGGFIKCTFFTRKHGA